MLPLAQDVKPVAPTAKDPVAKASAKAGKGKPSIVLVRADDRLIHGLVAVAWTSHCAETISVAMTPPLPTTSRKTPSSWPSPRA